MLRFGKAARDHEWGFTDISKPRFHKGKNEGVLICHGFGCTPSTMSCLFDTSVGMGFTAAMPLLTGHAETFGALDKASFEDWQRDVDGAYESLIDAGCGEVVLCGLSLGALLMADLAARRAQDGKIKGVFLICPPIRMKAYLNFFAAVADIVPFVMTEESFRLEGAELYYGAASRKLRDIQRAAKAALNGASSISCPVTLVEAENDSRVDPKSYELLEKKLRDHSRVVIPGAPHGIPYSDKRGELCAEFEDFLKK